MQTLIKHTFIILLLLCVASCYTYPENEHRNIYFENNSNDTVFVFYYYWIWTPDVMPDPKVRSHSGFCGWGEEAYAVAPNKVNDKFIWYLGYKETVEWIYNLTNSIMVYVLPSDYDGVSYHSDAKIVSYELTLDDLINLDFHLYYPPNEKMSGVKMDPPYETFVTKD